MTATARFGLALPITTATPVRYAFFVSPTEPFSIHPDIKVTADGHVTTVTIDRPGNEERVHRRHVGGASAPCSGRSPTPARGSWC